MSDSLTIGTDSTALVYTHIPPAGERHQASTLPSTVLLESTVELRFDEGIAPLYLQVEPVIGYHGATGFTDAISSAISSTPRSSIVGELSYGFGATSLPEVNTTWLRRRLSWEVAQARTQLSLRLIPEHKLEPLTERRALADLVRWTGLSTEELGAVLAVSRRSIYNWLRGRPVRRELRERIVRAHAALRPLSESWDATQVGRWLGTATPEPATLISEGRWDDLVALVRDQLRPLRPLEEWELEADEAMEAQPYNSEVHRAALQAFCTPPLTPMPRRPTWRPAELTGATSESEESD